MAPQQCRDPERWRSALSARLDGEDPAVGAAELERHLRSCRDCAEWHARSLRLVEELRAGPPAPDLALRLVGVTEAHICGCHRGEPCECTDCQCTDCTCGRRVG